MKILPQNNNINFTSRPIHRVKLPKVDGSGFVDAVFSRLDPNDALDIQAVKQITYRWTDTSMLLDILCDDFHARSQPLQNVQYYALETLGETSLAERLVGISEIVLNKAKNNHFKLLYLVVKPEYIFRSSNKKIKNVGKVLLTSLINMAQRCNVKSFSFVSATNAFYDKVFRNAGIIIPELGQKQARSVNMGQGEITKYMACYTDLIGSDCDLDLKHNFFFSFNGYNNNHGYFRSKKS